jgi:hypothetical protein
MTNLAKKLDSSFVEHETFFGNQEELDRLRKTRGLLEIFSKKECMLFLPDESRAVEIRDIVIMPFSDRPVERVKSFMACNVYGYVGDDQFRAEIDTNNLFTGVYFKINGSTIYMSRGMPQFMDKDLVFSYSHEGSNSKLRAFIR